jgi:excisionase family DNA binding protein
VTETPDETAEPSARSLTLRPKVSHAARRFVANHPDAVPLIVATALETAAELDVLVLPMTTASLPAALQRLATSNGEDTHDPRVLTVSEAADLLRVTCVTVYAWIEEQRLLAWRSTKRGIKIPAEQIIGPNQVIPDIEPVLAVLSEPVVAWDFLTHDSPYMDPQELRRPIEALKKGQVAAVIAAANSFLDAFV